MNNEQFLELQQSVTDFEKNHCFMIDAKALHFDKYNSQIRKGGHVKKYVPQMAETMRDPNNEIPPASIKWVPCGSDEIAIVHPSRPELKNHRPEIKEGCTRGLAGLRNDGKVLVSDYHDQVLQFDDDDWEDFQVQGNDHPLAARNTKEDMEKQISRFIKTGRATRRLGFRYDDDPERFIEESAQYCKDVLYKNSGRNLLFFKNRVIKGLEGKIQSSYMQYTTETAFQTYSKLNSKGWKGTQSGMEHNGHTVFMMDGVKRYNPNIMGGVLIKRIDSPNVKYNLVAWVSSLAGKNDEDIIDERARVIELYDKYNTEYNCFDSLEFMPQIKEGKNAENLNKLIKVR